jgi:RND family efflux transporter MFP subunit
VVEAVNQTTISAQTRGQVQEILFDVDDYVEKGALIIRLKDTEQQAGLIQASAEVKAANARLGEARDEHQRISEVFSKQLVARSALDKAETALQAAQARYDSAVAGLEQAREQYQYTQVRAPYSGIVTHRHVEMGEIANPGQALMTGISLDHLRVNVDVPQSLIPAIRKIGQASVEQPGNGYIPVSKLTIFPFADQASNTFKVRLELPPGTENMFPGMFVKTAFVVGNRQELLIPIKAVVHRSEVTGVYIINPNQRISFRHVRLGHERDGSIAVLAGLDAGEQVALDPIAAGVLLKQQLAEQADE